MNRPASSPWNNYRPYKGLPALAGLGTFEEAVKKGLSVEESVLRLKRHHYMLKRLHGVFISRITAEPIYELKMTFSYHAYLCAELVSLFRTRVGEMREPPLGLDKSPCENLSIFFDEILCAPALEETLHGIYGIALPTLESALTSHLKESHLLADQPSRRLCKLALLDVEEMIATGAQILSCMPECPVATSDRLRKILQGTGQAGRVYSVKGFEYDRVPRRDARFPDPFNMGVNAEAFLYDENKPAEPKVLMMFYKRLREIDVPEMMASILQETPGKPWDYYRDMTRQLWDEARHAMMGEVGFVSLGLDWPALVMVNFTWSLNLNTQLTPKERHAVLYYIEQGLMPKTGKRHEWEVALMSQNELSATFQDFDWADEVLHARIGRDWYVADMPSSQEAIEYGDQCWSKVMMDWRSWKTEGLTQHRNWWPDLYRAYCESTGQQSVPEIAAFDTTYETTRADLKAVAAE